VIGDEEIEEILAWARTLVDESMYSGDSCVIEPEKLKIIVELASRYMDLCQ
jgi:hypothetical protein